MILKRNEKRNPSDKRNPCSDKTPKRRIYQNEPDIKSEGQSHKSLYYLHNQDLSTVQEEQEEAIKVQK